MEKDNLKKAKDWFLSSFFLMCLFLKSVSNFIHVAANNVTNRWEKYHQVLCLFF